ncbi:MAG TPA: flagellar protein FlgN [Oculatellaceae cyanobacterium]|jgi:predicted RNase H-like nuclease (RuvC/YqgF family)
MSETFLEPELLDKLYQALEAETEQHQKTVDLLQRKKAVLVTRKPKDLIPIDRELMSISRKSRQLESECREIMAKLGHPDGRLENLIARLDAENVRRFRDVRMRLSRAVQDMGRLNQESRSLLDLSLNWIQETVEIITAAISPEAASYDAQGGKAKNGETPAPIQSTVNHSV